MMIEIDGYKIKVEFQQIEEPKIYLPMIFFKSKPQAISILIHSEIVFIHSFLTALCECAIESQKAWKP